MREKKLHLLGEQLLKAGCNAVNKIAQPLFESFDLTFFSYKLSIDDQFIFLTNNYDWLKNCIDKNYVDYLSSFQPEHDTILWDAINKDSQVMVVYEDARLNYNIDHGFTIIKSSETMEEHFNFATTRNNYQINDFYLHHQDILERFILYFKDKAKKIIEVALNHAINLKDLGLIRNSLAKEEFYREIDYFIENTQIKTIQIPVNQTNIDINYTLAHTAYYYLQGLSYKKIARAMYVSVKTVEARMAKLRKVTETKSKADLIHLLQNPEIKNILDLALFDKTRHKRIKRGWIRRLF
ncbi:helix-turn-helix transcriptional regulator [Legionella cardiaca]|uniref:LuxR C-terminal-related transcriptional regulator n=1 Tax=Legionella cardiaca TaxID=1071983 RepID=A0ABY8AUF0_9GAMM|nr:LuxR C-terminal-related transcriptional regulator [Legionella cardiaca]WED42777.1 LuxR C-terminal-related transcriptional regulator [Legionella cardiaca]